MTNVPAPQHRPAPRLPYPHQAQRTVPATDRASGPPAVAPPRQLLPPVTVPERWPTITPPARMGCCWIPLTTPGVGTSFDRPPAAPRSPPPSLPPTAPL